MKQLFRAADTDQSGEVSLDEYLYWALRWMAFDSGMGSTFQDAFCKFDISGDQELNLVEFQKAVEPFGYGDIAHHIFRELDVDRSGTIKFQELLEHLKRGRAPLSSDAKRLLVQMSFTDDFGRANETTDAGWDEQVQETRTRLDTSHWGADATEAEFVCTTLRERSRRALIRPIELWRLLVASCDAKPRTMKLTQKQLTEAIRVATGFGGPDSTLAAAFQAIDDDNEGLAAFDEFQRWVTGMLGRRALVRSLRLHSGKPENAKPLNELDWNVQTLCRELEGMLRRHDCSSYDLLLAHDKSTDGVLERR